MATVQAIDLEKRELTLKGPLGEVSTVTVDKAVKRLDEIKAGDQVTAKYYLSVAAELREPTDDEQRELAKLSAAAVVWFLSCASGVSFIGGAAYSWRTKMRPFRKLQRGVRTTRRELRRRDGPTPAAH